MHGLSCALKEKGPNLELEIEHNTWLPNLSVGDPTTLYHIILLIFLISKRLNCDKKLFLFSLDFFSFALLFCITSSGSRIFPAGRELQMHGV